MITYQVTDFSQHKYQALLVVWVYSICQPLPQNNEQWNFICSDQNNEKLNFKKETDAYSFQISVVESMAANLWAKGSL